VAPGLAARVLAVAEWHFTKQSGRRGPSPADSREVLGVVVAAVRASEAASRIGRAGARPGPRGKKCANSRTLPLSKKGLNLPTGARGIPPL
jgi:hypothetical protein